MYYLSLYIYTYTQSGRRWYSSIIGGAPGHPHWEYLEMHHLVAIVVKRESYMAESPPSTLRSTSRDFKTECIRRSGSGSRSTDIGWEDMILPGIEDPCNWVDPHNLGQIEWDHKVGMIGCVFSLDDKRRWRWDDVYRLWGQPKMHSPLLCPPPLHLYLRTTAVAPWQRTPKPSFSEFGGALGDREIEWTQRCTWRPWLSEFRDALGGRDRVNSEMHLEAVIDRVGRYAWRPWSIMTGGVLGGRWSGGDWSEGSQSRGSQSGGCGSGGMCDGCWDAIHWLTWNCGNVENWVQQGSLRAETGWERETAKLGMMQYMVYVVLGVCGTRCMLYSVYAALSVNSWSWHGEIERDDLTSCS